LRRFKGQLTILCVSVLFILLAADLSIDSVFALGWGSVWTVLVLMAIVRPLSITLCTWKNGMNWRQKVFLAWVAPRGIVSASVASLFAILLTQREVTGGEAIKALVFLTILMTVFFQGLTAHWVAKGLQITSDHATGAVIIGCNELSCLIGRLLQEQGESVVFIDTDPEACQKAQAENLPVFQSSGLDPEVLAEVGLESMGTFVALTNNGEVNLVLAQRAIEEFTPPRVLAFFPADTAHPGTGNNSKIHRPFLDPFSLKTWNSYLSDGQVKLGKTLVQELEWSFQQAHLQALMRSGELLPLLVKRHSNWQIVEASEAWQVGDIMIYLLHDPRPKLLKRLAGGNQSSRLTLETLSEVEEVPLIVSVSLPPTLE
jgi:Trk K+ transport system NAD-binding subunit